MVELGKIKKIHFIGVGGIGISALAKLFAKQGKKVSGSDLEETAITEDLKKYQINFFSKHKSGNLDPKTELVVYSAAVPEKNPERKKAREFDIPQLSYPEVLGLISKEKDTIAICGTNGKTTTTSMAGLLLEAGKFDPLVVVGSKVENFTDGNLRFGKGENFVVEACEYRAHMLNLEPKIILLTNIEEDHLDFYTGIDHIKSTFQSFIDKLPEQGVFICNADDANSMEIKTMRSRITYGIDNLANVTAKDIYSENGKQYFDVYHNGKKIDTFSLNIPGRHNVYNALAVIALGFHLKISVKRIKKALENYQGAWRRFEKIGEKDGAIFISDYAHHPTSLRAVLRAAKDFYPHRRVVAVFQPHQHNRTKNLFVNFVKSLDEADLVIINEIYDVAGREEKDDEDVNSQKLVEAIKRHDKSNNREREVIYTPDIDYTEREIARVLDQTDVILLLGAGDMPVKIIQKLKLATRNL
ncbi:MAG: UDP-N-acetylmuramate--L-alanine ligase [Patescibacteria group bacterium]|nr:UDP-N-acetylmuramate--L-alanine ligase [Patescibacteria group bacterium]MDD5490527.1 UDP-N-acetylmuramate--L-alanine ligase [Patescibacteria group bacterium]